MTSENQRYIIGSSKNGWNYLYVKDLESSQSAWITKKIIKSFVSKLKVKILESIHQNSSIQLKKQEVIKDLIQQANKWKISANTLKDLYTRQKSIIKKKQYLNSHQLFKHLKINIITPQFWESCYYLVKQPELFEILGKRYKSNNKYYYYLIKYKYFTDPQTFLIVTCSNFDTHPFFKSLRSNQIKISQDSSCNRIINLQNLKQKFLSDQNFKRQNRKMIIIGTAVIFKRKFLLVKLKNTKLKEFQWKIISLFRNLNTKSDYKFSFKPTFYRDQIKNHIIQELRQSKNISNQETQNVVKIEDHFLDLIVQEKIQFYLNKLQRLKKAFEIYYEGLQIFEPDSNSTNISSLRQKMLKIQDTFLKESNELVTKDQAKKQYQPQDEFQNDLDYEFDKYQKLQQSFYSKQQVKFQNEFEQTRSDSGSYSSQDSAEFFQKIKNQCKEQAQQDQWLKNKNPKLSKKNRLSCKKANNKSKAQIKRQKIQEKNLQHFQHDVKVENDVDQFFNQSLRNLSLKSEFQLQETKKQQIQLKKVRQISKFKNVENQDFVYRVKYDDDGVAFYSDLKQLQKMVISNDLIQKAELL